jgi:hypothetical protein
MRMGQYYSHLFVKPLALLRSKDGRQFRFQLGPAEGEGEEVTG